LFVRINFLALPVQLPAAAFVPLGLLVTAGFSGLVISGAVAGGGAGAGSMGVGGVGAGGGGGGGVMAGGGISGIVAGAGALVVPIPDGADEDGMLLGLD
jgi:hypothetical protein